jgi:hypothetical protein
MSVLQRWIPILLVPGVLSCSRKSTDTASTLPLPVQVRSDTAASLSFPVNRPPPPRVDVWVSRVAPVRSRAADPDLPDAPQDTLVPASPPPPMLEIDDNLKAPILRARAVLTVPSDYRRGRRTDSVELDVRVDETGEVTDALWAGGSSDSVLVQAATECALHMRFYPALQSGRAVPVWCRQRFDFGDRER